MDRRRFLAAAAMSAAGMAAGAGAQSAEAETKLVRHTDGDLATPCGLFCGFCRMYMNGKCKGCGIKEKADCPIYTCCREKKKVRFCTQCDEFLCQRMRESKCLDVSWLEALAKEPMARSPGQTKAPAD